mmetsp:Transcript_10351/g.10001  ORF Transcript_10351/g.10001 Transcript_10351/m.10001 type:complete len:100 (-) Transcript_10351:31-330(-)
MHCVSKALEARMRTTRHRILKLAAAAAGAIERASRRQHQHQHQQGCVRARVADKNSTHAATRSKNCAVVSVHVTVPSVVIPGVLVPKCKMSVQSSDVYV